MALLRDRSTPFGARFRARAEHDEAVELLRSWLWHNPAQAAWLCAFDVAAGGGVVGD
jgi:hypothetical protein